MKDKIYDLLHSKYGNVKRARGNFLYTQKEVRLVDLNREGGKAILGWSNNSIWTMFKNALERGATGSYYTCFTGRLQKAVSDLLNSNRNIHLFGSKKDALVAGLSVSSEGTNFFKPWNGAEISWQDIPCVVVEVPLPWAEGIYVLAVQASIEEENQFNFGSEKSIPGPLEAAATRSIYNLVKALQEFQEKDFFVFDSVVTKYWTRRGPYLYPKMSEQDYGRFKEHCLDCHILISTEYNNPSIVPFGCDRGVFSLLKKNPFDFTALQEESQ